jgi:peptide chain release factor subunit 3
MHMHTIIEEVKMDLMAEIDRKTKAEKQVKFILSHKRAKVMVRTSNIVCGEKFETVSSLGRFTLRDCGR